MSIERILTSIAPADGTGMSGKVGMMMPMLRDFDFDVVLTHNRFTLLNRNAEALIDFAVSRGMAVLNAAPYGSGILAKPSRTGGRFAYQEAPDAVIERTMRLDAILRMPLSTPRQANPAICDALVGGQRHGHLQGIQHLLDAVDCGACAPDDGGCLGPAGAAFRQRCRRREGEGHSQGFAA